MTLKVTDNHTYGRLF